MVVAICSYEGTKVRVSDLDGIVQRGQRFLIFGKEDELGDSAGATDFVQRPGERRGVHRDNPDGRRREVGCCRTPRLDAEGDDEGGGRRDGQGVVRRGGRDVYEFARVMRRLKSTACMEVGAGTVPAALQKDDTPGAAIRLRSLQDLSDGWYARMQRDETAQGLRPRARLRRAHDRNAHPRWSWAAGLHRAARRDRPCRPPRPTR